MQPFLAVSGPSTFGTIQAKADGHRMGSGSIRRCCTIADPINYFKIEAAKFRRCRCESFGPVTAEQYAIAVAKRPAERAAHGPADESIIKCHHVRTRRAPVTAVAAGWSQAGGMWASVAGHELYPIAGEPGMLGSSIAILRNGSGEPLSPLGPVAGREPLLSLLQAQAVASARTLPPAYCSGLR